MGSGGCERSVPRNQGDSARAPGHTILEQLFTSGNADEVRLAETFADPSAIPPHIIAAALQRTDLDPAVLRKVRAALGRAMGAQPKKYDPSLRAQLGQPGSDSLLGPVIIADHDWFLTNMGTILGSDPDAAANRLWYGVQDLNADEARTLRAEIDSRRVKLGDAMTDSLLACIDGEVASGTFNGGDQPRRW